MTLLTNLDFVWLVVLGLLLLLIYHALNSFCKAFKAERARRNVQRQKIARRNFRKTLEALTERSNRGQE